MAGGGGGVAHGSIDVEAPAVNWTPHQLPYDDVVTPFADVPVKDATLPIHVRVIAPLCPFVNMPAWTAARAISLSSVYGLLPQMVPPLVVPVTVMLETFPVQQLYDLLIMEKNKNINKKKFC